MICAGHLSTVPCFIYDNLNTVSDIDVEPSKRNLVLMVMGVYLFENCCCFSCECTTLLLFS